MPVLTEYAIFEGTPFAQIEINKKSMTKYFLFLLFPILLLSCKKDKDIVNQSSFTSTTVEYNQIPGVDANLLSLDIYYKEYVETKKPIVIFVHGGGWAIGDKADQIQNKVNLFESLNYVFVSINYRLSPFPYELNNPNRIKYPTHNKDAADAIKWVVDNIDEYGGDPNKIALMGHSAGAQLVALTGTDKNFLEAVGLSLSSIKGVAIIDTKGYDVLSLVQENKKIYVNAFGTNTTENKVASPLYQVEDGVTYPPFFIAKRGNAARIAIANDFIDSLESKGVSVSQVEANNYSHIGINKAIGKPNETKVTDPLKDFFEGCFE